MPVDNDTLMTPDEVAEFLRVKPRTLESWRSRTTGPRYVRLEGAVRYWRSDVTAYLDRKAVSA